LASGLPEVETWACRGLTFTNDQRIAPYEFSPLTQTADEWGSPPNRLLWIAVRQGQAA
jgi:hypothetical protein